MALQSATQGTPTARAAARKASRATVGGKVKPREVMYFTSQLSLMLEVGTSLADAIEALARQTNSPRMRAVLEQVLRDLEQGMQFSDALARHGDVFDTVYVSMIRAGEAGGFMRRILDRIFEMQERREALIAQLRSALTYPAILCTVALGVIVFMLVGILPKFMAFFEGKEDLLPRTTLMLMGLSKSLQHGWIGYIVGIVGLVAGFHFWKKSNAGKRTFDRLAISLPGVAGLCNMLYTCQLLRTMGLLMESRVPMLEALDVTRETIGNEHYRTFIDRIKHHVQQGGKFSRILMDYPYIIESVKQMVATGEESGQMYTVMLRLAEFYDKEVENDLRAKSAMIEPAALIVLGVVIGVIVSAIILPLFKLAYALR